MARASDRSPTPWTSVWATARMSGRSWWNDRFYITGTIKALDAEGEFFHDAKPGTSTWSRTVAMLPSRGRSTSSEGTTGSPATKCRTCTSRDCVSSVAPCDCETLADTVVEQCDIRFPSCTTMIGETMPKAKRFETPATGVYGNDNTLKGLYVAYASGNGIMAAGFNNRVEDCIVHDVGWFGTIDHAGIAIRPDKRDRTQSTVSHCTVYNVGNIGIRYYGGPTVVEYNHVHHTGLACHDIAAIHTGSPAAAGSVARYNWVHHSMGLGMRGDDQTRGLTVHHNLVWDCDQGIIVKGDHNKVYHNTILGSDGHGRLTIPTRQEPKKWWTKHEILPVQNANSLFFNNYCEEVTYRYKPVPQNQGISHNVTYDGKTPYTDVLTKVDARALKSGQPDPRPREGSCIIDQGKVVEGLTDGYTGKAPDVGAYEYGKPLWRAGALRTVPSDIVLPVEAEVARSWKLEQSGRPSVPIPRKLIDSKLSSDSKKKLQSLYDSCWTPDELERRRVAIQLRGEEGSAEYARHHPVVAELHARAHQRLVDRVATVLVGQRVGAVLLDHRAGQDTWQSDKQRRTETVSDSPRDGSGPRAVTHIEQ